MYKIAGYTFVLLLLQACNNQRPATIMNNPAEESNIQNLSWAANADPVIDAQNAIAGGDMRLLVSASRGMAIPGVSAAEAAYYREECGVKPLPGSTDAFRDENHLKQFKTAYSYAETYNRIVVKQCVKGKF